MCLALHEKDRALVEAVRDELARARMGTYKTRTTLMVRFSVSAPGFVQDLASHGIVNAKSLITVWPSGVPDKFVNSFVCGYFDGDGSLGSSRCSGGPSSGKPGLSPGDAVQDSRADRTRRRRTVSGPRHEHAWSIVQTGEPVRALDEWIHRDVPGLARKRLAGSGLQPSLW